MSFRIGLRSLLLALLAAALFSSSAAAVPKVDGEFQLGEVDTNNKIVAGPDGNMWMTVAGANDVARITPAGVVTEYNLEIGSPSGIASAGGRLWVTGTEFVTSFLPGDPEGSKVGTEIAQVTGFHSIVLGPDGNLWVATEGNLIRIPPAEPKDFKRFEVAGLGPRDIDTFGTGLVIADFGGSRILTATTADPPVIGEIKLDGGSQGVAGGPNNLIGFTEPGASPETYGLLTPPNVLPADRVPDRPLRDHPRPRRRLLDRALHTGQRDAADGLEPEHRTQGLRPGIRTAADRRRPRATHSG